MKENLSRLFVMTFQGSGDDEQPSSAERLQLIVLALGAALACGAVWGLGAGSSALSLALANVWKVPLVLLMSVATALPASVLAFKIFGAKASPSEVTLPIATGVFAGCAMLATLAPLVGIFYLTSTQAGPLVAMGTVALGLSTGIFVMTRNTVRIAKRESKNAIGSRLIPVVLFCVLQLATLMQCVHLTNGMLPEQTFFDDGIDGLVKR
ncbi:MAG: hypothetical protein GY822_16330 [Deltaproteobacteria bacterium]|nr:hypothetical protein [Deltaproteobacteria bacterium]